MRRPSFSCPPYLGAFVMATLGFFLAGALAVSAGDAGAVESRSTDLLPPSKNLFVDSSGDCGGREDCYPTLQEAIDIAIEGDFLLMAAGDQGGTAIIDNVDGFGLRIQQGWNASFTEPGTPGVTLSRGAVAGKSVVRSLSIRSGILRIDGTSTPVVGPLPPPTPTPPITPTPTTTPTPAPTAIPVCGNGIAEAGEECDGADLACCRNHPNGACVRPDEIDNCSGFGESEATCESVFTGFYACASSSQLGCTEDCRFEGAQCSCPCDEDYDCLLPESFVLDCGPLYCPDFCAPGDLDSCECVFDGTYYGVPGGGVCVGSTYWVDENQGTCLTTPFDPGENDVNYINLCFGFDGGDPDTPHCDYGNFCF